MERIRSDNYESTKDQHPQIRDVGERVLNGIGNYERPEIISESEAKKLTADRYGLYESFEEIQGHCPEQLRSVIQYLGDGPFDEEEAYAAVMAYMDLGKLYDKNTILTGIENERERWRHSDADLYIYGIDDTTIELLPEKFNPRDEAIPLSSALHLMHQNDPDLRDQAMGHVAELKKRLAKMAGIDLDLEREIGFPIPKGEFLTGKDAFPEYLQRLVEERVKKWRDDVSIEYGVTWLNSHLDNGEDYTYDIPEYPYVRLYGVNEESLGMAEDALSSITQEDVERAYRERDE